MNLIIVESPTKARTLSKFLGSDYAVEATTGHIMDLPKSRLGIEIEKEFEPQYEVVEKRKSTITAIQKEAKKAKQVFIATDPDREGEAIAYHVREILNAKNTNAKSYRITFHEITKEAVEEAIKHPTVVNKNLVDAQIARRVLDRLVGYKLSPVLWKKVRVGLSAGRVQTVAVRLIVEKEREIEKFKPEEYWEVFATTRQLDGQTSGQLIVKLIKEKITNGKDASEIVQNLEKAKYSVSDVKKKEVRKSPYPPFTTSTLTQAGARLFGWTSKRTMSVAQKLYEQGLITYHRTDSVNIATVALEKVRKFIQTEYGDKYLPETPRYYKKQSKSAQEAHEAIRPTSVGQMLKNQMLNDESKLYELIWKRFVASQMNPAVYDETTIEVNAKNANAKNYELRASGQIMKFDGWRRIIQTSGQLDSLTELPQVEKGEELDLIKVESFQKFTMPPARYNEASLIKMLEKLGIGRPSTYAPVISTIQIRNYVEKNDSKAFVPTTIGFAVTDFLVANFPDTFEYQFTAGMEENLDKVAEGKLVWVKTIKDFYKPLEKKIKTVEKDAPRVKIPVEKIGRECPLCGKSKEGMPRTNATQEREAGSLRTEESSVWGELVIRVGRFGKFISCSRFPDCKYTEKYLEKVGIKCPDCNEGDVIVKKAKRGKFFGCSRYPDCKFATWKNPKISKDNEDNHSVKTVK